MSYYTGRGDYYSGKGDPGFLSTLGSIVGTVGSVVGSVVPGVSGITSVASKLLGSTSSTRSTSATGMQLAGGSIPAIPTPGVGGAIARALPGGSSGYQCGTGNPCESGYHLNKGGPNPKTKCVRNRRTNYTNPKALSRAAKRLDGFVGIARSAMKSTNYKVVSKSYKQNWRKPLKK